MECGLCKIHQWGNFAKLYTRRYAEEWKEVWWATWESSSLPRISREARWQLHHQKKAWTLGQQIVLQASPGLLIEPFWSDVWKVLRLHPGSENKVLITWQCLPWVQQGACWMSTPHVLAVSWMTATARSLLCSHTTHWRLRSVKTNHPWPLSFCAPLFREPTSYLILHCPLSVLMVQNTSTSGLRARECV